MYNNNKIVIFDWGGIVESHFLDKNSRPFHNFNKQKEPIKAKAAIDKIIEILQPSA